MATPSTTHRFAHPQLPLRCCCIRTVHLNGISSRSATIARPCIRRQGAGCDNSGAGGPGEAGSHEMRGAAVETEGRQEDGRPSDHSLIRRVRPRQERRTSNWMRCEWVLCVPCGACAGYGSCALLARQIHCCRKVVDRSTGLGDVQVVNARVTRSDKSATSSCSRSTPSRPCGRARPVELVRFSLDLNRTPYPDHGAVYLP